MKIWPFEVISYSPEEVQEYCVNDELWQQFRLSLKGITTERKLDKLFERQGSMLIHIKTDKENRRWRVQESNYINALKRGGQLSLDMKVQK